MLHDTATVTGRPRIQVGRPSAPASMRWPRSLSREVLAFLAVGTLGYVVDVGLFNWLATLHAFAEIDPTVPKVLAVAVAMVVTYAGNRFVTWRGRARRDSRRRELVLFVVFNLIGLGIAVGALAISHDVLGLTSRLADNVSANVIGLGLGTAFRFWSYRHFVFNDAGGDPARRRVATT
ncbi:MAG: GtrA family protein [Actinomycetota bacterium]|nr:GtrA family protein [Actinomycetota bacterium]